MSVPEEKQAWIGLRDTVLSMNHGEGKEITEQILNKLRKDIQNDAPLELVQKAASDLYPNDSMAFHVTIWFFLFHAYMNTEVKYLKTSRMEHMMKTGDVAISTTRSGRVMHVKQNAHLEEMDTMSQFAIYTTCSTGAPIEPWRQMIPLDDILKNDEALYILWMYALAFGNRKFAEECFKKVGPRLGETELQYATQFAEKVKKGMRTIRR